MGPNILVVIEGMQPNEGVIFTLAFMAAAKKNGINEADFKKALGSKQIVQEKLDGKEFSAELTIPGNEQYGRILSVGSIASNKVGIQNMKNERILLMIPNPRSWDDKMKAGTIESMTKFLKDWSIDIEAKKNRAPAFFDPPTEEEKAKVKKIPPFTATVVGSAVVTAPAVVPQTKAVDLKQYDATSLEAFLQIEVSNSRLQACIFNWTKDSNPTVKLTNAEVTRAKPLEDFVPVLVSVEVLKDEIKMNAVRAGLDKAGYKNTYLMPIHEFTQIVYMYKGLAEDRKVIFELVV